MNKGDPYTTVQLGCLSDVRITHVHTKSIITL